MTPARVRLPLAIAALAALPALSGCVAAVLPVMAAGTVVGVDKSKDKRRADAAERQGRVAIPAGPEPVAVAASGPAAATPSAIVRSQDFSDGSRVEVTMPTQSARSTPVPELPSAPAPEIAPGDAVTLADGTRVAAVPGGLPPPGGAVPDALRRASLPAPAASLPASGDYGAFTRFAADMGTLPIAGAERRSAMLSDPEALSPVRRECSIHPAAVMIDLDPAGATLDPQRATRGDPALADALARLRADDIAIAWVSSNTADRAGAVRRALVSSGLDPAGRDELVLLRFPEERKQTRRQDVAKELCIVAIAGDERADFDELFQYLKSPAAGAALEPIVGNGWFLIPTPLS
ncbi:HAD family hydrolase [Tsuneonella amylolytica]|uniref:hypothetical protein n=1 Tax=Tsuneonella amylolytica TaxID=2338327 RepID=UPI000EA971F5|nr:hypothetical protein [Tsuneonella amylolytica]